MWSAAAPADFFMRNKPNLCVFWDVSGDCEEKQTQFKADSNPISPRKTGKIPCSTVNCSTVYFLRPKACRKPNSNPISPPFCLPILILAHLIDFPESRITNHCHKACCAEPRINNLSKNLPPKQIPCINPTNPYNYKDRHKKLCLDLRPRAENLIFYWKLGLAA